MKRFLRCIRRRGAPRASAPDTPALDPLAQLVDTAEPNSDLFDRIEAQIDATAPERDRRPLFRRWRNASLLVAVAAIAGAAGFLLGPDRQRIVARPNATAEWVPLGSVTLHGPALRAFVRGKCRGHTHFFITMHVVSPEVGGDPENPGTPLSEDGEKILMECIF